MSLMFSLPLMHHYISRVKCPIFVNNQWSPTVTIFSPMYRQCRCGNYFHYRPLWTLFALSYSDVWHLQLVFQSVFTLRWPLLFNLPVKSCSLCLACRVSTAFAAKGKIKRSCCDNHLTKMAAGRLRLVRGFWLVVPHLGLRCLWSICLKKVWFFS